MLITHVDCSVYHIWCKLEFVHSFFSNGFIVVCRCGLNYIVVNNFGHTVSIIEILCVGKNKIVEACGIDQNSFGSGRNSSAHTSILNHKSDMKVLACRPNWLHLVLTYFQLTKYI